MFPFTMLPFFVPIFHPQPCGQCSMGTAMLGSPGLREGLAKKTFQCHSPRAPRRFALAVFHLANIPRVFVLHPGITPLGNDLGNGSK